MDTVVKGHIEPNQNDPGHPKLDREIHSVKSSVPAPADHSGLSHHNSVSAFRDPDSADAPRGLHDPLILRKLEALKVHRPFFVRPPLLVAGVKDFRPRGEFIGVVYNYEPRFPFGFEEVRFA